MTTSMSFQKDILAFVFLKVMVNEQECLFVGILITTCMNILLNL
jgi:hypothetical protein